jgi:hypothetical protein
MAARAFCCCFANASSVAASSKSQRSVISRGIPRSAFQVAEGMSFGHSGGLALRGRSRRSRDQGDPQLLLSGRGGSTRSFDRVKDAREADEPRLSTSSPIQGQSTLG